MGYAASLDEEKFAAGLLSLEIDSVIMAFNRAGFITVERRSPALRAALIRSTEREKEMLPAVVHSEISRAWEGEYAIPIDYAERVLYDLAGIRALALFMGCSPPAKLALFDSGRKSIAAFMSMILFRETPKCRWAIVYTGCTMQH